MDFYARAKMLKKFCHLTADKQKQVLEIFNKINKTPINIREIDPRKMQKESLQYKFAGFMCLMKLKGYKF